MNKIAARGLNNLFIAYEDKVQLNPPQFRPPHDPHRHFWCWVARTDKSSAIATIWTITLSPDAVKRLLGTVLPEFLNAISLLGRAFDAENRTVRVVGDRQDVSVLLGPDLIEVRPWPGRWRLSYRSVPASLRCGRAEVVEHPVYLPDAFGRVVPSRVTPKASSQRQVEFHVDE